MMVSQTALLDAQFDKVNGPPPGSVPIPGPVPEGAVVGIATGDLVEPARRLEYEVFREQGYCQPSDDGRVAEYRQWDDLSRFHVVVAPDGRLAGVLRTTIGAYGELPAGAFARAASYPVDPVLEVASLAVPRWARNLGAAVHVYRSAFQEAVAAGVEGVVAIGETWLLELLNRGYDFGFRQLGPSRWYMGGDCFPMGSSMADIIGTLRERQPQFLSWMFEGLETIDLRTLPSPAAPG